MRKLYPALLLLLFSTIISLSSFAQNYFTDAGENATRVTNGKRELFPQQFRGYSMDVVAMRDFLWSLPSGKNLTNRNLAPIIHLPMPDGQLAKFKIWESSVMAPELAAKFPEMRSFTGQGIDDPYATLKLDFNPYTGFHAQILSFVNGRVYIDPYARGDLSYYISYYARDFTPEVQFLCHVVDTELRNENNVPEAACLGTTLRTYRLALACTGEYSVAVAGPSPTVPAVAAAMNIAMNRVNGVYETEVALTMVLVPNNNLLIYLDGTTDPYTNNNGSAMLAENQANIDAVIGSANYDIGHVFSTGGGGIATLNSPCNPSTKARGVTGLPNPVGDPFYIDYVAHEMGHQWGANHSMAGCGASPINTKYEVGSGTTIQGYAGICGAQDIQPNSDPYFHSISFDEISNFIVNGVGSGGGPTCGVMSSTGNTLPVIDPLPLNGVSIPPSTPFTLTGTASDGNGDALTYSWEQWDIGGGSSHTWNAGATAAPGNTVPLFKARIPKTTGVRTFPDIAVILAGYPANPPATMGGLKGETLSPVTRIIKFRLNVRDNRAGGSGTVSLGSGGCQDPTVYQINVAGSTPFTVSLPNGGESWAAGSSQTVTWNNAGTNAAPFNVANVKISLSTDGGVTYPTVILASTPNDGSETITVPGTTTSTARIKIEAINNIFFDVSNNNFNIIPPPTGFSFSSPAPATSPCPAGPSMQIILNVISNGGFSNPVTLSASGNPPGTTVGFSVNPVTPTAGAGTPVTVTLNGTNTLNFGSYTVSILGVATGSPNQTRDLTYTITQGAGPAITGQPSSQTICVGGNTSFSITSATATSIQWQVSTNGGANYNNVTNGGVYSGATTATLSITGATLAMNGYLYRAIASTQCGSTTSSAVTLTVNASPAITGQPGSVSICNGNNTTLSVTATGGGLTYQWQSAPACAGPWTNVPGATSSTLNVNPNTTTYYQVIVSGSCAPPATSNCATVTVVDPPGITSQPANATACEPTPGTASFSVAATSATVFQWQLSTNGGSTWNNVVNGGVYSGATTATLSLTGVTPGMNGYQFRVLLSNATCTTPVTSAAATLTVNTIPTITAHPLGATMCVGNNITFSVTATGTGLTYQWRKGGVNISGATSSSYSINGITTGDAGSYDVVVSGACPPSVTSNTAVLNVNTPITITTHPSGSSVCATGNAVFTVAASGTSPTYQWQESTNGGTTWTNINNGGVYGGATTTSLSLTNITANMNANQYRAIVTGAAPCGSVNSNSATLNVTPQPVITAAPFTSLLPGRITTLSVNVTPGPNLNFVWYLNGTPIPGATGSSVNATVTDLGNYHVTITNTISGVSCTSQIQNIKDSVSGRLFIYPSPNGGQFTVSYYNAGGASTGRTITIFDSKGRQVYNRKFTVVGPYTLIPIDIRPSNGGVYHVVVGDNSGTKLISGKVLVQ